MKNFVITVFCLMMIVVIYLASDMKNAYKILPGNISGKLEIPAFVDWREFTSTTGLFSVSLPAPPQSATEHVAIPKSDKKRYYEMYVAEKLNGAAFMISLITYPPDYDLSQPPLLFREIVDELLLGNPNNRLDSFNLEAFLDKEGAAFHIHNPELIIIGREFLVGSTLYLLTYVVRTADFDQKDYDHFINSFVLLT